MSDEQGSERRARRRRGAALEAPESGSADELLDAGAQRPARPDAPLGRARHGRGGPRPVPGHEAGHRAGHRGRLLLRLRAAPAADARRPGGDRGADGRESIAADHPFVRREMPPDEGRAFFVRAGPAVQGRDPRRPRDEARSRRRADAADDGLRARPVHRPLPRAARRERRARSGRSSCSRSPARTGAATRSGRCSSASTARSGRRRRSSTATSGGARRRRSATTAGWASQLDLFCFHDVSPGRGVLAPQGLDALPHARDAMRELQAKRGYQEIYTPPLVHQQAVGAVGPLGPLPREHVPGRGRRADVQPQADELPRVDLHLPLQGPLVPRSAAAAVRVRRAPPQRAVRRAVAA